MQELENCYKKLISQEQPYAPAKFTTKVNENTPTYELPIHRQATMDNINREITLLREKTNKLDKGNRKHGHKKKRLN